MERFRVEVTFVRYLRWRRFWYESTGKKSGHIFLPIFRPENGLLVTPAVEGCPSGLPIRIKCFPPRLGLCYERRASRLV